jgi:hypothetical protein
VKANQKTLHRKIRTQFQADPLLTGKQAMQRLECEQPGFYSGSLRTLQRRMTDWNVANAEKLVGVQMGALQEQENK